MFVFGRLELMVAGVPASLAHRVFPVLQLTRMALVFTAIADSACALLLLADRGRGSAADLSAVPIVLVALISIGLYGFGMSLNDIIDRRRDRQLAAHRPLPSGRIDITTAHAICAALGLLALAAGAGYWRWTGQWMSFVLVVWAGLLIAFYDFAGKYLVAPGLLTLGLIRFFHAVIPAPSLPLLWHPLLLLNHVTLLSVVAYAWEQKRPALTRGHWWGVLGGLTVVNGMSIALVWWRRGRPLLAPGYTAQDVVDSAFAGLRIEPGLAFAGVASVTFIVLAWMTWRRHGGAREAGQTLMLYGLLWLIVYDAAFVVGYVGLLPGLVLLALLPLAYGSVQLMRWWGRLMTLSQRPAFKRAGEDAE
jgi:hypothetical protein